MQNQRLAAELEELKAKEGKWKPTTIRSYKHAGSKRATDRGEWDRNGMYWAQDRMPVDLFHVVIQAFEHAGPLGHFSIERPRPQERQLMKFYQAHNGVPQAELLRQLQQEARPAVDATSGKGMLRGVHKGFAVAALLAAKWLVHSRHPEVSAAAPPACHHAGALRTESERMWRQSGQGSVAPEPQPQKLQEPSEQIESLSQLLAGALHLYWHPRMFAALLT